MGGVARFAGSILGVLCALTLSPLGFFSEAFGFSEAPMLAKQVEAGKLPPVDKRLPPQPVVLKPCDKPGVFGGTWRRAYLGMTDLNSIRKICYEPLVRWSPSYTINPNLALSWEIENEGRVFTFHLVKGARWSDGAPFTADDILFYVEDVASNKEITSVPPRWLAPQGKPPKVTKLDDFTVRFEFEKPYGLFLQQLACPQGVALVSCPKHYLKQFHKKYAKEQELEALVRERKAPSWAKLFVDASNISQTLYGSTDLPSMCAWITKVPAPNQRFVLKRNPYYWKVDPTGKQLPYIDFIVSELQAHSETILLKAVAGEIDMQARGLGGMQNSMLLLAGMAKGDYRLVPKDSTASVGLLLAPNLNHPDPVMRKILSDPRFRKALSHAINRNEINRLVYRGKGTMRQAAPLKDSAFYSQSYESAYIDHNVGIANTLLDEMGLKMGEDGKRLRPDGQPLLLLLDVMTGIQSWVDTAEIVASNLKAVGIQADLKSESRELFRMRTQSAAHDIALWPGDGGMECLLDPRWYFPYNSESLQAPLYAQWYQTRGKQGEEPPAQIKELMSIFDQITVSPSEEKQKELFDRIIKANEENLWVIGLVGQPADYYVVAKSMFNVAKRDFQSWIYPNPGPIHPEQFSFTKPQ